MLNYTYIKFRAWYFHYVSTPMEIPSQDFISEFHLLFQQRFTQIFDEVTHSPQLSVIPGTAIATVSLDNWYSTSEFTLFLHCIFILKMLKYIQIVSISDSSRKEIYGNTKHNNFKWGDRIPSCLFEWCLRRLHTKFSLPGRSAKQIFQTDRKSTRLNSSHQ